MLDGKRLAEPASSAVTADAVARTFARVRTASAALVDGLAPEDTALQSMPDASPSKWHLAHTSWFFEQFVLARDPAYVPYDERWNFLFNSYYQSVGPMHARPQRGLLSRPTLAEVLAYRQEVDARVQRLLARTADPAVPPLVTLGLHHEQQHQELLLTDLKHLFSLNPLEPAYRAAIPDAPALDVPMRFIDGPQGVTQIGHAGEKFAFDCETPRHRVLLQAHAMANRPVNNEEFRTFVRDGGYRKPALWLSEGWNTVTQRQWQRPLYWGDDLKSEFTLRGRKALDPRAAVSHLSFFEADAFARWAGARLPTEAEWEVAAAALPVKGNLADSGTLHPGGPQSADGFLQVFGDVWEWTGSPYLSYPGYRPPDGALGEYNGKFMCGQYVLRGGSCITPADHVRATYRNFFTPADRWQFSGVRLAQDR